MKRITLSLLMLVLINTSLTPLAVAQEDKAESIAWMSAIAKCGVKQGMLLPDGGKPFFAWLIGLGVEQGDFTIEEVKQIINEKSFKNLTEASIFALGGCSEVMHTAKPLFARYVDWLSRD